MSEQKNYSGVDISKTDFTEVDVSNSVFDDCEFHSGNTECEFNLDFSNSKMQRIKMEGLYLYNTNFYEADLTDACFDGAAFQGVEFSNAILNGASMTETNWCSRVEEDGQWSITLACKTQFVGANLSSSDMSGVDLTGANLTRAKLSGVDLSGADLTGAELTDADLTGAILTGTIMPDGTIHT